MLYRGQFVTTINGSRKISGAGTTKQYDEGKTAHPNGLLVMSISLMVGACVALQVLSG